MKNLSPVLDVAAAEAAGSGGGGGGGGGGSVGGPREQRMVLVIAQTCMSVTKDKIAPNFFSFAHARYVGQQFCTSNVLLFFDMCSVGRSYQVSG